jgi:hypothetical protein
MYLVLCFTGGARNLHSIGGPQLIVGRDEPATLQANRRAPLPRRFSPRRGLSVRGH